MVQLELTRYLRELTDLDFEMHLFMKMMKDVKEHEC